EGDPLGAIAAFGRVTGRDPKRAVVPYTTLFRSERGGGRPEEVLAAFGRAAEVEPDNADHQATLGATLAEQGDHLAAIAALRRATGLDRTRPEAWHNLGVAAERGGDRPEEALAAF